MRQQILAFMRSLGLLSALERVRYWQQTRHFKADNTAFQAENPDFMTPPLWWMHDMYGHTSYRQYLVTGREHAATLMGHIDAHAAGSCDAITEWGCGLARILRHFPDTMQRTGTDYNSDAIAWVQQNVPGLSAIENDMIPPWDVAPASQDVVYAVSIFTHLAEDTQNAWVRQIAQTLRPGGLFLFTVHGAPDPGQLLPAEQAQFDRGQPVYRAKVKEGSRLFASYHPDDAVREIFAKEFEYVDGPLREIGQTLWVMRKKT